SRTRIGETRIGAAGRGASPASRPKKGNPRSVEKIRDNPRPVHKIIRSASMKSVILHYQEIALKGKNRPWFVARLVRNLREATSDLDVRAVRVLMGRIEMELGPDAQWEVIRARLSRVFGIGNFA